MATFEVDNPANPTGMMIMMLSALECCSSLSRKLAKEQMYVGKVGIILLTKLLSFANKEFLARRVRCRCTVNINFVINGAVEWLKLQSTRIIPCPLTPGFFFDHSKKNSRRKNSKLKEKTKTQAQNSNFRHFLKKSILLKTCFYSF